MNAPVRFNPFDRRFLADPYPQFRQLRELDPVHWSVTGSWVLTRHDDIKAALGDGRLRTADTPERVVERAERFARTGHDLDHLKRLMGGLFVFANPPEHTVRRGAARSALATSGPAALAALIAGVVEELIDSLAGRQEVDLVADFAEPLAGRTIARMMGLADAEVSVLQRLSHRLAPVLDSLLPLERYRELNDVAGEMLAITDRALESGGGSEFLQGLASGLRGAEGRALLTPLATTIFFAGQETTVSAIANSLFVLASDPARVAEVMRQPADASAWVQELLRFESPVQLTARDALVDFELRGRQIKAGQRLVLYLGAANRDPAVFADPDRLDLGRDARAHLAFSSGIHRCLGAHVAVEEMRQGITALLGRFPSLALLDPVPHWRATVSMRGIETLRAVLNPPRSSGSIHTK